MALNYALLPESVTMYTQTEAFKEAKDASKNLVSGKFERDYRVGMPERSCKRKLSGVMPVAAALAVFGIWLLVLTVVHEVQIARLRQEVDQLTANMIAMTTNLKSLNQKLSNNRIFNEFKTLEDTLYADDQDGNIPLDDHEIKEMGKDKPNYESLEKLQGLTVLEDEDDEDVYDGDDDDAESGDWYPDYDKRREKVGTTNMVRLKPEDFTGEVVARGVGKTSISTIREIKRMLNENPENPDIVLPNLPPTDVVSENTREKRSVNDDAFPDSEHYFAPRVVAKSDERRKTKNKKYNSNIELPSPKTALHTVSRITRNSDNEEGGSRRSFVAAHFHGNTSHLNTEIHEHYKGNGLIRVAHEAAHDVWYPSPWTLASPHPRPTLTRNGHVHVHHTGIYLVYVQIYYLDPHDIISWVLHRTNPDMDGREAILQCAQSSHSTETYDKPNTCFSAAALFLRAGDKLAVRNTGGDRHSLMQPEKSFIGLVKLADADEPSEEL